MEKEGVIDSLLEKSGHGTRREDIEAAYAAGVASERERKSDQMTPQNLHYPNGMTVAELKEAVKDWPETDEYGNPCEVWLCGADGLSNQARTAGPLNMRRSEDGSKVWADLIIEHDS